MIILYIFFFFFFFNDTATTEIYTLSLHDALPIRLGLLQPGPCVLCAVADPSERAPVATEPGHLAETGRGLHVIGALSDQWGYTTPSDMGKVVWAMFSARPGPPHAGSQPGPMGEGSTRPRPGHVPSSRLHGSMEAR